MKKLLAVDRANSFIDRFKDARVLVIGDLIMDHFIWGKVRRISPEAPVPVVEVTRESLMLGGSANVVNNIVSLGGRALVTGVVGRDFDGEKLTGALAELGIATDGIIVDETRPTTIKTRVIAHSQQVVRFDRENRDRIDAGAYGRVLSYIKGAIRNVDIVVISDYAKGLISPELLAETVRAARAERRMVAVDPKVEHMAYYKGATIVTPNNLEASIASGIEIVDDATLHKAGERLSDMIGCEALLITRGENGMSLFEAGVDTHIPTVAREVYDVSGAGDTVIGALSLALAVGADFKEAAVLANFAAGVVVGKIGTATLTTAELKEAVSRG